MLFLLLVANLVKCQGASSSALKLTGPAAAELPYHPSLQSGTQTLQDPDRLQCRLCGAEDIPIREMRAHISAHILEAQVGVYVCWLGGVDKRTRYFFKHWLQ